MTIRDDDYLKQRFEDGDVPSGTDFGDLIDSKCNVSTGFVFDNDDLLADDGELITE